MFDRTKNKKGESRAAESSPAVPSPRASARGAKASPAAVIGASIHIQGDVTGEETLVIQGHVEGTVNMGEQELIIGERGRVFAEVRSRVVCVQGEVTGNITGDDLVAVTSTGNIRGNIVAPRVTMEDGAQFKGMIDMDPEAAPPVSLASSQPASDTPREPDIKHRGKA